eukprot:843861-Rhodomonas_salina.1
MRVGCISDGRDRDDGREEGRAGSGFCNLQLLLLCVDLVLPPLILASPSVSARRSIQKLRQQLLCDAVLQKARGVERKEGVRGRRGKERGANTRTQGG